MKVAGEGDLSLFFFLVLTTVVATSDILDDCFVSRY